MPITPDVPMQAISCDAFHSIDYKVMDLIFSIHRNLGRFWNEKIYQNELKYRCQKAGFEHVAAEVPIHVSCDDFTKTYKIDLLVDNGIYELKTAQALTGEHKNQTINYLMLAGLYHAKLVNMRPPSVQHRFVSTTISPEKRYNFIIDDKEWLNLDKDSIWLRRMFKRLLGEWGAFLDINLFYDAIGHFLGGEENVVKKIEVADGARVLGTQKVHMLNSEIVFKISSIIKCENYYENQFRRFIRFVPLKAIHWINFCHDKVVFKTIVR